MFVGHCLGEAVFGAERSLLDLLAAADRRHFELSCVFPGHNDAYLKAVAEYTSDITVFPYRWSNKESDEDTVARFEALFRDARVDLVHVNTITLADPLRAARRAGVPSILHARELITLDEDLARLLRNDPPGVVREVQAAADFIIANSDAMHQIVYKPGRSFRLYNTVDIARFDLPNELQPERLRVGIISNNGPRKGIEHFVRLAILAGRKRRDLEFIAFGPLTEQVEVLEQRVQGERHPVNLRFAGYAADPVDAMRQVDVIVSCSIVPESFGRTMAEAMAARRPVIAYDHGAAAELIRHGVDGFVVPYGDLELALQHLCMLSDHADLVVEMGRNGRQRAQKLFAPEVFAGQLNGIYREVLRGWETRGPESLSA